METLRSKLWSLLLLFLAMSIGKLRGDDDQAAVNATTTQSQTHNSSNNATFFALDQVNGDPTDGKNVNYTSVVVGNKNTNDNGYFRGGNRGDVGGGGGGGNGGSNGGGGGGGFSWGWAGGGGGGGGGHGWGWGGGGGGGGWWKWGCGGQPKFDRSRGGGGRGGGIVSKSNYHKFHRFDPNDYVMGEYAQCMVKGRCKGLRLDCPLHCGGPCLYDCRYMCKAHCRRP